MPRICTGTTRISGEVSGKDSAREPRKTRVQEGLPNNVNVYFLSKTLCGTLFLNTIVG